MENKTFALKGNIVYTKDKNELCINEQSYLVCENGKVRGIYKELPDELKNVPVEDMGDQLIIPGLTDLHVHAPQYSYRGLGNGYGIVRMARNEYVSGGIEVL